MESVEVAAVSISSTELNLLVTINIVHILDS